MSTPLYHRMKSKGSTMYSFPSTSSNPNPNFSKFVLLDIPARTTRKVLDFNSATDMEDYFEIFTYQSAVTPPYADQLVESLRNYVANHDVTMRESKLNQLNDFYNIKEPQTPTEKIFWKWLRKFGAIDFEPAVNKVDWNKNLVDFDNPNSDTISNTDFFKKYLWKEREVTPYTIENGDIVYEGSTSFGINTYSIYSNFPTKFKIGDKISISITGATITELTTGLHEVLNVIEGTTDTTIYINVPSYVSSPSFTLASITLSYHKLVQYIGEINAMSQVHTATKDETEVTAYIPHQAGRTPTILWDIKSDTNYYPSLELPLLPIQIRPEIRGAENLISPIRQNPGDYPGSYYGQFDSSNKTYLASNGDKVRYSGDYYGILRNNNVGLSADSYVERLSEFNSDNIDGLTLDFNLNHYLKMDITDESVGFNFDEFNQLSIDGEPPVDFSYNAILWYNEVVTDNNTIIDNLYGITFLNNPDNDDNGTVDDKHISTYEKLVQSEEHDGLSYVHVLNLSNSVDNDTSSLSFDPLTLNNTFGFDLYNNVMSNIGKLNQSFINIINEFVRMNSELNDTKSLVYSQTDIDLIKSKLKNMEDLLVLYSKYQFVETDTVKINEDYSGVYPTLSFDVKGVEYESVISTTTSNIYDYMASAQREYPVDIPETNKLFLKITNTDIINYGIVVIIFNTDLQYKQSAIIYIDAKDALYSNKLDIYMNYDNGTSIGPQKTMFIDDVFLPSDISSYVANNIVYSKTKWLSSSIYSNVNLVTFTGDTAVYDNVLLYMNNADIFGDSTNSQIVYIHDFKLMDLTGIVYDFSGIYSVDTTNYNQVYIKIVMEDGFDGLNYTPIGIPKVYLYKGVKIEILRVDESTTSSLEDRYLIQKTFI